MVKLIGCVGLGDATPQVLTREIAGNEIHYSCAMQLTALVHLNDSMIPQLFLRVHFPWALLRGLE